MHEAQSTYKAMYHERNDNNMLPKDHRRINKLILKLYIHVYTNNLNLLCFNPDLYSKCDEVFFKKL